VTAESPRAALVQRARRGRIIVKIGSGVLADGSGRLAAKTIRRLATDIAPMAGGGRWPFIVSSGAIAVGMGILGLRARPRTMPGLQAAAAVGQSKLVEAWSSAFRRFDLPVAQVLLTHADLSHRARFLNARRALSELQRRKAVTIINENDSVSFEEIALGDNDGLAADVSNLVDASILVLLSVAPGIIDRDGRVIDEARADDPALDAAMRPGSSRHGVGGMRSKLQAARKAVARGAHVAIIDGTQPAALPDLLAGKTIGTVLGPAAGDARMSSRAHWIAHTLRPVGTIIVDAGAARAIATKRKSLLASGVTSIMGDFGKGDAVDIRVRGEDQPLARGLSQYTAKELNIIAGSQSASISAALGYTVGPEAVHKDDLVVLRQSP
jgi:glutamate 5-kinase